MPSLIAIMAAVATAGGVGLLLWIVVGSRAQKPATVSESGEGSAVAPSLPRPGARPRGVADRVTASVPKGYVAMLERQILLAGRPSGWTVDRILIAKPLLAIPASLGALWFINMDPVPLRVALGIFVVVLAVFVPELLIYSRAMERQQKMELELPDTLDQMTISVEAGLGFESAMAKAGTNGTGPLAEELIRTLQDMSIGRTRRDAYESLGQRTSSVNVRRFTRAVIQADEYGIAIADVLRVQAGEMRLKRRQRAEEQAMKVPVKVIFPLVFCILPVLFIVLLTPAVLSAIQAFT